MMMTIRLPATSPPPFEATFSILFHFLFPQRRHQLRMHFIERHSLYIIYNLAPT